MTNEFDIFLHPMVINWFMDFSKKEPLGFCYMIKGNPDLYNKLFGKTSEKIHRHLCWRESYLGATFFIYSNNENTLFKVEYLGSFEMFVEDKKMGSYIVGFLNNLVDKICN